MHAADVISGALLGSGALTLARAAWLVTAGSPLPVSGRPRRSEVWGAVGLIAVGCGVYVHVVFAGRPPLHPFGTEPGAPWWQVATVGGAVLIAAAAAGVAVLAARAAAALRRRRRHRPAGDGDLAALTRRHDALRERYGALLSADPYRLDVLADQVDQLAAALARAADLRSDAAASYTHRSQYARAVGEAEAAWAPVADTARSQGLALPDAGEELGN